MKTLYFDLFNTVFDIKAVATDDELRSYARQIEMNMQPGSYKPFDLPTSWGNAEPIEYARGALRELQGMCQLVTLSNAPIWLQCSMSMNFWCNFRFDAMVPLQSVMASKPDPYAYAFALEYMEIAPKDAVMVTANEKFGDLEQAAAIGMETHLVGTKERWEDLVRKYG